MSTALDVRSMPTSARHPEIFRTFDALAPGGSFVLVNDHDPRPLLLELQAQRKDAFEWNVLERSAGRWRVEIQRRPSASARSVTDLLGKDHERLDALFDDTERLVGRGDFSEALARFLELRTGLERHIDVEEGVLFPEFEKLTGIATGPSTVMRAEHAEIRGLLADIEEALRGEYTSDFIGAAGELRTLLSDHDAKEEQILYPMTDTALGADGADRLVALMQSY